MQKDYNQLDSFLQEKVEMTNFSFKEEYWQKMEVLLDDNEKSKKKPFLWRGLSMFFVVIGIGLSAFLYPKLKSAKSTSPEHIVSKQTNSPSTIRNTENSIPSDSNTPNTQNTNISENTSNSADRNDAEVENKVQKKTEENDVNQNKLENKIANKNSVVEVKKNLEISTKDQQQITANVQENGASAGEVVSRNNSSSPKKSTRNSKIIYAQKTNQEKAIVSKGKATHSQDATPSDLNTDSEETVTAIHNKPSTTGNLSANHATPNQTTNATAAANKPAGTVNIAGRNMKVTDSIKYTQTANSANTKYHPRYFASLSNYVPEVIDHITLYDLKSAENTEPTTASIPEPIEAIVPSTEQIKIQRTFEPVPFSFFIFAGMNANKGFKGNVNSPMGWGFSPYVGMGFEKPIAEKITMGASVGFTYFNGLNTEKKQTNYIYSFGYDSTEFSVDHKKMFQMVVPLSIQYQLLSNHFLSATLGVSYAYDIASDVKETKDASTKKQFGYSTGFNQLDVFAQIGYGLRLSDRTMFQLMYQQGFIDMTKNTYFNNSNKDKQTRISIGFKYSFHRNEY